MDLADRTPEDEIAALRHELAAARAQLGTAAVEIAHLRAQLAALRRQQYGQSSERLDAEIAQLELRLEDLEENEAEHQAARPDPALRDAASSPRAKAVRRPLPDHLPRETVMHEPEQLCTCCEPGKLVRLGEDVTEVLEKIPARLKVMRREGWEVNRKRAKRLMTVMAIEAIYQKPNTSKGHPDHKVYPYLLRGLIIERPNQVWCADITYIPMAKGFVYLVAVMDWFSRRVLSWRLSITMETDFCVDALTEAMERYGRPEIFNTDQGVQFTSAAFVDELVDRGVRISMDGKGRYLDNIFIERLWRSLKYEEVYIRAYDTVAEARRSLGMWLAFYNNERPHQSLEYRTPREMFEGVACEYLDNTSALLRDAPALPTYSQAHRQEDAELMY